MKRVAFVALLFVGVIVGGNAVVGGSANADTQHASVVLGPGDVTVTLSIKHSHFSPDRISVRPGTTVRFVVQNDDPIGHELIVGDAEVHRRHEAGTEAAHPPRPGEISIAASSTAETTFRFDGAGEDTVQYACHLPGHFRYGMFGEVTVES